MDATVESEVPRDRVGLFEPQIVRRRQRRLTSADEMVLSLSPRGLTHGDISAHLVEVCSAGWPTWQRADPGWSSGLAGWSVSSRRVVDLDEAL